MNITSFEINPRDIKLLEENARFMTHEEYCMLVDNIRRDGHLSSAPFLCLDKDGKYECLSGNHRVMAAIDAGLDKIIVLATNDELSEQQKIAIQLSHNSIVGQDDPATLKALYGKIIDVELKKYSGLDDKVLELIDSVKSISISEASLQFQTLSMVFLPDELEKAQSVMEEAMSLAKGSDCVWLARMKNYDDWLDAQETASSACGVKNVASAVDIILKIFQKNVCQLAEAYEEETNKKRYVPIQTVLGQTKIPAGDANKLHKVIEKMISKNEINKKTKYKAIDVLADMYLGCE